MPAQQVIGLDLGYNSIKAVELVKNGQTVQLESIGSIPTPPRGLLSDTPLDEQGMVDVISRLLHDMKVTTKLVNTSLPESQVFTRVIDVPKLSEKELASSIQWEAEQYIPLPIDQVNLDYAILGGDNGKDKDKMKVLLVAAPIKIIEKYTRILENAGLTLASIETEAIALSRILPAGIPEKSSLLLLNLGATSTDICIVRNKLLNFVRTIPTGGESLTRAISEELGFSSGQAEEYKRTYGLEKDKLEGKVFASIQPVFVTIIDEIKKIIAFYKERYPTEELSTIILSGGTAKLPGAISYLASETGINSQIGNPFENIVLQPNTKASVESTSSLFTVATGLALKDFVS